MITYNLVNNNSNLVGDVQCYKKKNKMKEIFFKNNILDRTYIVLFCSRKSK